MVISTGVRTMFIRGDINQGIINSETATLILFQMVMGHITRVKHLLRR